MTRALAPLALLAGLSLFAAPSPALTPLTGVLDVDAFATRAVRNARVAMAPDGSFVVAYEYEHSATDIDLRAVRFAADGRRIVGPAGVDLTVGHQTAPVPAILPNGGFAVAYVDAGADFVVKRYSAAGALVSTSAVESGEPLSNMRFAINARGTELLLWWHRYTDAAGTWAGLRAQAVNTGQIVEVVRAGHVEGGLYAVNNVQVTAGDEFRIAEVHSESGGFSLGRLARLDALGANPAIITNALIGTHEAASALPDDRLVNAYLEIDPDDPATQYLALSYAGAGAPFENRRILAHPRYSNWSYRVVGVNADLGGRIAVLWGERDGAASPWQLYLSRVGADGVLESGPRLGVGATAHVAEAPDAKLFTDADGELVVVWRTSATPSRLAALKVRGAEPVDLVLTQLETEDPAPAGGLVQYRVNVRNAHAYPGALLATKGFGGATRVGLVDTLPEGSSFQSASGTGWTCTHETGQLLCDYAGLLKPQASTTLAVAVRPPASATGGIVFNDAAAFAEQQDPDAANNGEVEATHVACGPGSVSFVLPAGEAYSVLEAPDATLDLVVERAGGCGAASVTLATRDYSATAAAGDYEPATRTLRWADGETGPKTVALTLLDDALDESRERLRVVLLDPVNVAVAGSETLVAIQDDDAPPLVRFERGATSVGEGAGSAAVALVLSAVSGRDVVVGIDPGATGSDAASEVDYEVGSTTVTIPAGWTRLELPVGIDPDAIDEVDERFTLTIVSAVAARLGRVTTQELTIVDDDTAGVSFALPSSSVAEGTASRAVAVKLSTPSSRIITVPLVAGGSATAPDDYTGPATVSIAAGAVARNVVLSIVNDSLDEPAETVELTLGTPSSGALGAQASHTVTIADDD